MKLPREEKLFHRVEVLSVIADSPEYFVHKILSHYRIKLSTDACICSTGNM